LADGERLIIRGGSAGGLTTLCALTFHDVFKVGASYYGVSDLKGLDDDSTNSNRTTPNT
jgi:dipeptidyl aminopeptidase/acylaminoacyl peptidase